MSFNLLLPFLHGAILAFSLIIPAGIQNIFILNQSIINKSVSSTLPIIITASLCDTVLIVLSVLGLSLVLLKLESVKLIILILGFFFLVYMGYKMWTQPVNKLETHKNNLSKFKQVIFTISVSWLNPHAIIDTIVVIGSQSLDYSNTQKITYSIGCILVTWLWFFLISFLGNRIGKLSSGNILLGKINKLSAILMYLVATYTAFQILNITSL